VLAGENAMLHRRTLLAAAATIAASVPTLAQGAWPQRPVRVVVPWPPGGSTDVLARLLSERLSQIARPRSCSGAAQPT
jgi:tripartite-type tricarboxylate transporter receptor subunit TctC